jgi:outer membrane lipoprotein
MKTSYRIRGGQVILFGIFLAAVSGCASYPVTKALRQQAKPLTLAQMAANPAAYTGTIVIWGGRIISAVNNTNGGSIYVLALPLTGHERPEASAYTIGRFIARGKGFLDPEVFRNGQLVTVAGEVSGVVKKPLQGVQYTYPLVTIRELHLWYVPGVYYPYYAPGWYRGWYGPRWEWDWHGPGWGWSWGWAGPGWEGDYPWRLQTPASYPRTGGGER